MNLKIVNRKIDGKGFSLIELIIVVTIMGVLIAVLAPQYIRYIEKSRVGKDTEVAGVVRQAINVAMADPSIKDRPMMFSQAPIENIDNGTMPDFASAVKEYLGTSSLGTFRKERVTSKTYADQDILVEINASAELVEVTIKSNYSGIDDIVIR